MKRTSSALAHEAMTKAVSNAAANLVPKTKRARIQAKITYDDLDADDSQSQAAAAASSSQLQLAKVERYLHGPVPSSSGGSGTNHEHNSGGGGDDKQMDLNATQYHVMQDTQSWNARTPHKVLVSATAAVNALGELSPGGALMRGFQEQSLARKFLWNASDFF